MYPGFRTDVLVAADDGAASGLALKADRMADRQVADQFADRLYRV